MVMSKRQGYKIFIDPDEKLAFDQLVERLGSSQTTAGTRLFRWFLAQDQAIQFAMLGAFPDDSDIDVTQLVLESLLEKHRSLQDSRLKIAAHPVKERGKRARGE